MDVISNILENYPIQTGLILIGVCIIIIILEIVTNDSPKIKNTQTISWKSFFKKWLFLLIFIIYGLMLIFKNL